MIRATFAGFNIAASGMSAAQRALDVTGNNMSNVNTIGYTRQRLDLNSIPSASPTDRYAVAGGVSVGDGVRMVQVAQLRDPFLDRRFRNEAANIGEMDARFSVMSDISRIFDEVQFNQGLFQAMQNFRSQLQTYSPQTGEITLDATVASSANTVLRMFQQYAVQIAEVRDYQMSLLNGHGGAIQQVNGILENIALLNRHIRECHLIGNPALELQDQRNMLIDQLSAYIRIDVSLEPDPYAPDLNIMRITFLDDNPTLNEDQRTLVHGLNYTNLKVGTDRETGNVFLYKETPQPNKINGMRNWIVDPPTTDPMIGGLSNADWEGLLSDFELAIYPDEFDPLTVDPNDPAFAALFPAGPPAVTADHFAQWQNHWNTYFDNIWDGLGADGLPTDVRDPFRTDLNPPPGVINLAFRTGALRGAVDMLNSKGAFDNPPNTLNGIGYYEMMLDRIVADFAEEFNKANQASNPIRHMYNQHRIALDTHLMAVDAHNVAWNTYIATLTFPLPASLPDPNNPANRAEFLTEYARLAATGGLPPGFPAPTGLAEPPTPSEFIEPLLKFFDDIQAYTERADVLAYLTSDAVQDYRDAVDAWDAYLTSVTDAALPLLANREDYFNLTPEQIADGYPTPPAGLTATPPKPPAPPTPPAHLAQFFNHDRLDLAEYLIVMDPLVTGDPFPLPPDPLPNPATDPDNPLFTLMPQLVTRPLFEAGLPESPLGPDVITARNIQIAEGWRNGTYMLTTTRLTGTEHDDFSGQNNNLLFMISLFERPFNFTTNGIQHPGQPSTGGHPIFTGGFEQMFRMVGLTAANDASSVDAGLKASANVIMGIEDLRNAISSVSMDEEGVNLLRFQKSYAAAARVMTTLDEALDILINRTGIVGR